MVKMSSLHGSKVTSAPIANGEVVTVNDHVYVSIPWSERDGSPYIVARIIEFLPPPTVAKKGSKRPPSTETQVRLSLYYRPSDISGRHVSDFRLLMAAIHTDIHPLSNVRGKCYVRHKDRIDNLLAWKKMPDHFYFTKFFDPYIKREYEVLRTENVHNIPPHVKAVLMSRYEYLVMEKEMVADLTDSFRSCSLCSKWAASQESVRCDMCKNYYHMTCLNPPLAAKPAKGYSWVCFPCTHQRVKDVEGHKYYHTSNPTNGNGPVKKNGVKSKDKAVGDTRRPDVTYRGWSMRYFGQYTVAADTLDPDDPIFPRSATRVGVKFQANVPTWEEQQALEAESSTSNPGIYQRGSDDRSPATCTATLIGPQTVEFHNYLDTLLLSDLSISRNTVDFFDMACKVYNPENPSASRAKLLNATPAEFGVVSFTPQEKATFEASIERNGGLEQHEMARLLHRSPADVLRYYYIWRNEQLREENEALRHHQKIHITHGRTQQTLGAPTLGKVRSRAPSSVASDDETSLYDPDDAAQRKLQCAACSTRLSKIWWRAPRSLSGESMCENCGTNYRKYGVITFTKAEDSKRPLDKRESTPMSGSTSKKSKLSIPVAATPPPPPPPKLAPCVCCRKMEPKASMARCKNCTFSAHSGCYGIPATEIGPDWLCELCSNEKEEAANLIPRCVLCPPEPPNIVKPKSKKPPADFDLLSALKPTEGCQWAHVLCSAWIPELQYTEPAKLKRVEGVSSIPEERWTNACTICMQEGGAVISCADCDTFFHPSCAYLSGYRFGFEFSLVKVGKREAPVVIAKFKEETGVMSALCWCKSHNLEGRAIYDMHEMDPEQGETALSIYTGAYKCLPAVTSFALLRKARRLDPFLSHSNQVAASTTQSDIKKFCLRCFVSQSPMWYPVPWPNGTSDDSHTPRQHTCHQCHFRLEAAAAH